MMKTMLLTPLSMVASFTCGMELQRLNDIDLVWKGKPDEVRVAVVSGSEKSNGMYIYRVRFPKGHKIPPHFHSDERVVTVLRGILYVGYGNTFIEKDMKKLIEGGVWTEPKEAAHYVWAKEGEVELQVVGSGPSVRTLVNQ